MSSEIKQLLIQNATMASVIRKRLLTGIIDLMEGDPEYIPPLTSDVLKLLRDSEDRGFGMPTKHIELGKDERASRIDPTALSNEALSEVMAQLESIDGSYEIIDDSERD